MKKKQLLAIVGCSVIFGSIAELGFAQEQTLNKDSKIESTNLEGNKEQNKEQKVYEFPLNKENINMHKANGWSNGGQFNNTWRDKNVTFNDDRLQLWIDQEPVGLDKPYSGGEYRTNKNYHYGKYEVKMKPIKSDGVVSSFFTYTGPTENNPWDEIDIEFLGKDTTKVQFNYFTNSKGEKEFVYDLGFDASEDFHTYAFEWLPDSITWFVDGKAVHTATENIPQTAGKVMMNAWPGIGVDTWLKPFAYSEPLKAEYVSFKVTEYSSAELLEKAEAEKAEAEKAKAEAEKAEAEKAKAEAEKAKAEAEKVEAEKAKAKAEAGKAKAKAEAEAGSKTGVPKEVNKKLPQTGTNNEMNKVISSIGIVIIAVVVAWSFIKRKKIE